MKAILKKPGMEPEIIDAENELESLRELVGGHLEHLGLYPSFLPGEEIPGRIGILVDSDGKLKGLAPNFFFYTDIVVGNALFTGEEGEEFIGLTEEQIRFVLNISR